MRFYSSLKMPREQRPYARSTPMTLAILLAGILVQALLGEAAPMLKSASVGEKKMAPTPQTTPADSYRTLEAFDCAQMGPVEAVRLPPAGECPRPDIHVKSSVKKRYVVLQEAEYTRVTARRCKGLESRLPWFCGAYDHMTLASEWVEIDRHSTMEKSDCRRLWDEHRLLLGPMDYLVVPPSTFQKSYLATGTVDIGVNHVSCYGGQVPGKNVHGIVDTRYTTVITDHVDLAKAPDGTLSLLHDRVELPCKFHDKECTARTGTYLWDELSEEDKCRLFKVRESSGSLYTDNDGEKTFVSDDDTNIRLVVGEPTMRCGRMVHRTEHSNLFVSEELDEPVFQRELDPLERSPVLYGTVQAAALEEKLAVHIESVIAELKQESCRTRSTHSVARLDQIAATQRATVDGETASLGMGHFATASGEVWYRYQCSRIEVRAKDTEECYNALPVELTREDMAAHFEALGLGGEVTPTEFFLEPKSHRLLTTAAQQDCSTTMSPLYRTVTDRWIRADPRVHLAPTPRLLDTLAIPAAHLRYNRTKFATGGLYTAAALREMNRVRQLPNVIYDVEVTMGRRAQSGGWASSNHGSSLGPHDVLNTYGPWYSDPFGWFWGQLEHLGHVGSTLFGIAFLIKVVTWSVGIVFRVAHGPTDPRMTRKMHFAQCFFPSLIYYLIKVWNRRGPEPREEQDWTIAHEPNQRLLPLVEYPTIQEVRRGATSPANLEAMLERGPGEDEDAVLRNGEGRLRMPRLHFREERTRAKRQAPRTPRADNPYATAPTQEYNPFTERPMPAIPEGNAYQSGPVEGAYANGGDVPAHRSVRGGDRPQVRGRIPGPPSEGSLDQTEVNPRSADGEE